MTDKNRLKELRFKKYSSQKRFYDEIIKEKLGLNITLRTYQNWEIPENKIKSKPAQILADYFEVSLAYLLGYSDVPDKYRDDELLIDNGEGGFTSLSMSRHRELMEEYNERIKKEFINFLRLHDFVLSDNEIQAILEHITKLDVNSGGNIDYKRIITDQAGAPRKYLVENGYKELGDLFQSSKGLEDFYKEKGYDPDYTF